MVPQPLSTSRCLNSLLRYELAAVRCYQFAEQAVADEDDRAVLAAIRRNHAAAADRIRDGVLASGGTPSCDPGLWGVILTLVESSAAVFGRKSMLTVLLWTEQHAAETYESADLAPGLGCEDTPQAPREMLPLLRRHIAALEPLIERSKDASARSCGEIRQPEFARESLATV